MHVSVENRKQIDIKNRTHAGKNIISFKRTASFDVQNFNSLNNCPLAIDCFNNTFTSGQELIHPFMLTNHYIPTKHHSYPYTPAYVPPRPKVNDSISGQWALETNRGIGIDSHYSLRTRNSHPHKFTTIYQ